MGSCNQNSTNLANSSQESEESDCLRVIGHFHSGVCAKCYTKETLKKRLLRCGQCQLIAYCSKECQKDDWPSHRSLCAVNKMKDGKNVFDSARSALKEFGSSGWLEIRKNLSLAASLNMGRPLNAREMDIFYFPKVCEICKETKISLSLSCMKCYSVFYCSENHKIKDSDAHSKWCQYFLLCLECESYEACHGVKDLPFSTVIDTSYVKLPANLMAHLNPQLRVDPSKTLDDRFVAMISERLSYPLSLLYALQEVGVGSQKRDIDTLSELTLHVIGAKSSTELLGIIRWEYLLHRLPSVQQFHITFIGPELLISNSPEEDEIVDNYCIESSGSTRCEDCIANGRLVVYEMANMLYHDFIESAHYSVPDAIVAFNCGFHTHMEENDDTWRKSLELITQSGIPLVFTSYTKEESKKDLQALLNVNESLNIEIPSHDNPFKSGRPVRCPERESEIPLFFCNQYLTSVRGTVKYSSSHS